MISLIPIEQIRHRADARPRSDEALTTLSESIAAVGLINPIRVRQVGEGYEVIAGAHRLQACDLLNWREIPCIVADDDDIAAEMAMIAENLHRAELTVLQRDEQVARWIELAEARRVSAQVVQKPQGGRPASGVSAASRELGLDRKDASRAVKVASLSAEAKQIARETGQDNNRSALLAAAKHQTPEAQIQALQQRKGGIAGRYAGSNAQPAKADPVKSAERFIGLADQIEAIPVVELVSSGRLRATVGQRADGLSTLMDEIKERLNG